MTLEELKSEAKKLGYKLIKDDPKSKLPCVCGCNSKKLGTYWFVSREKADVTIYCPICDREATGKNERDAIENWNAMACSSAPKAREEGNEK